MESFRILFQCEMDTPCFPRTLQIWIILRIRWELQKKHWLSERLEFFVKLKKVKKNVRRFHRHSRFVSRVPVKNSFTPRGYRRRGAKQRVRSARRSRNFFVSIASCSTGTSATDHAFTLGFCKGNSFITCICGSLHPTHSSFFYKRTGEYARATEGSSVLH